ncbi:nuclear transport factor 2 family protein [Georgenia sp. AZ-5]|uniref:nuclear transport factor 2 family protein n=1 Tax=Georgenia sp. AZ-5 TaxID=3367526 RepID=UPI0037547E29
MTDSSAGAQARYLADVEEIKRLKSRYFRYMDTKQWDKFRALFCDDAVVDTSEATTDPHGYWDGGVLPPVTPDVMTSALRERMEGVFTMHHGHNPDIEIHSDVAASGVWAMEDIIRRPAGSELPSFRGWGHYTEEYRKEDGQWRFAKVKVTRLHVTPIDHFPARADGVRAGIPSGIA